MTEATEDAVHVSLKFSEGYGKRPLISGIVSAEVTLLCQRCLKPFAFPINAELNLTVVESESEIAVLPEEMDALIVDSGRCSVPDLVEDELILAMPLIAMHEENECAAETGSGETTTVNLAERKQKQNPFQILRELKDIETDSEN